MLTIFTPTYNRAYILPKLYESLREQSCHDLEWIIIDDGSTDDTRSLVEDWTGAANPFPIRYHRQPNGGKHRAINRGVELARGDFFFIVDSDDRLPSDAVETILRETERISDDATFAGLVGLRGALDGTPSGDLGEEFFDNHLRTIRHRRGMMQDMAEVFRTDYLRRYPFPELEGERFCTEALVWNRLDRQYRFRFLNRVIYLCEYRDDGLSAKYMNLLYHSPRSALTYHLELAHDREVPLKTRLRSIISVWRYYDLIPPAERPRMPRLWTLLRLIGRYFRKKDQRRYAPR
ncbi:glycosyltransferase family 2 protein [uncultured Porphyromonas sp.]|uniref:glycosyltransferase family 2 protein n=1 Tax=uncultured Porphyromonas sp. TaxID=159274 RepID=UPI002638E540|nr:glycosyltransferase family 2 protein [uncultured Porphyromonas sp.]